MCAELPKIESRCPEQRHCTPPPWSGRRSKISTPSPPSAPAGASKGTAVTETVSRHLCRAYTQVALRLSLSGKLSGARQDAHDYWRYPAHHHHHHAHHLTTSPPIAWHARFVSDAGTVKAAPTSHRCCSLLLIADWDWDWDEQRQHPRPPRSVHGTITNHTTPSTHRRLCRPRLAVP